MTRKETILIMGDGKRERMKIIPDSNEQWLLDGICQECRRKDYCSTPCKRNEVRIERETIAYIRERTGLGRIFDAIGVKEGESE